MRIRGDLTLLVAAMVGVALYLLPVEPRKESRPTPAGSSGAESGEDPITRLATRSSADQAAPAPDRPGATTTGFDLRRYEFSAAAAIRWKLPKERSKNGIGHLVAVSALAQAIIDDCPQVDGSDIVFARTRRISSPWTS